MKRKNYRKAECCANCHHYHIDRCSRIPFCALDMEDIPSSDTWVCDYYAKVDLNALDG